MSGPHTTHDERWEAFEWLLTSVRAHGAQALVVAGDLFDAGAISHAQAQKVIDSCGMAVRIIRGNHDSGLRSSHFASDLVRVYDDVCVETDLGSRPRPGRRH